MVGGWDKWSKSETSSLDAIAINRLLTNRNAPIAGTAGRARLNC